MNDTPVSYRTLKQLVPGDWFVAEGVQYIVLEPIFNAAQLVNDPEHVAAVHLGLGTLVVFNVTDEVVWIKKSQSAVRDWDEERGKTRNEQ